MRTFIVWVVLLIVGLLVGFVAWLRQIVDKLGPRNAVVGGVVVAAAVIGGIAFARTGFAPHWRGQLALQRTHAEIDLRQSALRGQHQTGANYNCNK